MRAYVVNPSLYDFLRAHASILDEIAGLDPKGEWIVRMDAETLHTAASCYFGTPVHRAGDTLQLRSAMREEPFVLRVHEAFLELEGNKRDPFLEWIQRPRDRGDCSPNGLSSLLHLYIVNNSEK